VTAGTRPAPPSPAAARTGAAAGPGAAPRPAAAARDSLPVRLAAFTALAAYGAGHWASLVVDPPVGRIALSVAIAVGGGAALAAVGRARLTAGARLALAVAVAVLTVAAALVATGLPARLIVPGGWAELSDGLDRGLVGIQTVTWPYGGEDEWVRLTLLLGAPLLLGVAASLAFWPARRAAPLLRGLGLVLLLVLYGMPATEHEVGSPFLRGLILLALVGAYLWLPRMTPREAGVGAAVVLGVGVLALPFAARLDADQPWWDYRDFNWFGHGRSVSFQWDHSYGPLKWPREGTTLMNIESKRGHYWKAEVLDRFDGFRWLHSSENERSEPGGELPPGRNVPPGAPWRYYQWNPRWVQQFKVTVRALRSDFVVGAGNTLPPIRGVPDTVTTEDGTTLKLERPLERGDSYTVQAYVPDPTASQMQGAPVGYPPSLLDYTRTFLPRPGESALTGNGLEGDASRSAAGPPPSVYVGLRGDPGTGSKRAGRQLERSAYGRMYRLARQVTAGEPNAYDMVKAIENHLRRHYRYQEHVPSHDFPLEAFLFEDKAGYCQQFSGAMALMLRMVGIPARVVSGFSPGSYNRDKGEWRVRDLDAHSWVEVYFSGIGWVPFDPTPAGSPAESRAASLDATSAAAGGAAEGSGRTSQSSGSERTLGARGERGGSGGGGTGTWIAAAVLVIAASGLGGLLLLRPRAWPSLSPGELADAQVRELRDALRRLGWRVPESATLLALERRLARAAGPRSAAYAARLRALRYDARDPGAPGRDERRALRRELTRHGGIRARLRGLLALPPNGPRPPRTG
jgi:transglutaminase-like putative cysteine protease